jgi:hypothetical protein
MGKVLAAKIEVDTDPATMGTEAFTGLTLGRLWRKGFDRNTHPGAGPDVGRNAQSRP